MEVREGSIIVQSHQYYFKVIEFIFSKLIANAAETRLDDQIFPHTNAYFTHFLPVMFDSWLYRLPGTGEWYR